MLSLLQISANGFILSITGRGSVRRTLGTAGNAKSAWIGENGMARIATNVSMESLFLATVVVVLAKYTRTAMKGHRQTLTWNLDHLNASAKKRLSFEDY